MDIVFPWSFPKIILLLSGFGFLILKILSEEL